MYDDTEVYGCELDRFKGEVERFEEGVTAARQAIERIHADLDPKRSREAENACEALERMLACLDVVRHDTWDRVLLWLTA